MLRPVRVRLCRSVRAGTAEFYQREAPDTQYPRDKWEYAHTLRHLAARPTKSASLLDIGAGKGHFPSCLIDQGWGADNLMATEFSAAGGAAIARPDVECRPADVRGLDLGERRFDAIGLFQVLEHLDGYDGLMDAVSRLAKPEAHLVVAVPNGARIAFNRRFRGRANTAVKAPGVSASRDAWRAAATVALAARGGAGVPHALRAHLRRGG